MFYLIKNPKKVANRVDRLAAMLKNLWAPNAAIVELLDTDRSYIKIGKPEYDAFLTDFAVISSSLAEHSRTRTAIEKFLRSEYKREPSPPDTVISMASSQRLWALKVPNGRDRFSSMKPEDLLFELGSQANGQPPEVCRWMLRGVPEDIAIKRVEWGQEQARRAIKKHDR